MKDLLNKPEIEDEELEARWIMAEEWNQFEVPQEIDERITELIYWNEEKEHKVLLKLMDEFEAQECYIRKCIWFSTSNYHYRKQEEARGAFYQSAYCKESCIPRRFRNSVSSDLD
ncbi:hypothetical protein SAMN04488104_101612 [Algoriphagus faecimaris]|uniref:Uncharacterized protein n=1 Tax=Algoriphagus faecimaris TaxID=686796 RepID=A0A1G6S993_9BACT|nr:MULTISPECIES: hypothetical protein [Algoriphagus]SDD13458.1 hypothetical protein SAMN04488104_101612 [Algoriphagus faecimaris]